MERLRLPFQGVTNIVRFNWHFYLAAFVFALLIFLAGSFFNQHRTYAYVLCVLLIIPALSSFVVSLYIYDLSNLYTFDWLDELSVNATGTSLNIHAGFDETSVLLRSKYPRSNLSVFDFFNPEKQTEFSIKRANKVYCHNNDAVKFSPSNLPVLNDLADSIFVIFSAHEIRNDIERAVFFNELRRAGKSSVKIIVTEHLRDIPNFLAYTVGVFHFYSRSKWLKTFSKAGLEISSEVKVTPFITTFVLKKNGTAP